MKFIYYPARDGWRWRLVARNGRIVADSGEPYESESNVRRAITRLKKGDTMLNAPVERGER